MAFLTSLYPDKAGVAVCGLPVGQGVLHPADRLLLTQGDSLVPLWWQVRGLWPDGSVKWLFYHADIPNRERLILSITPEGIAADFHAKAQKPVCTEGGWRAVLNGQVIHALNDVTWWGGEQLFQEQFSCTVIEDSPIAPQFLLRSSCESVVTELLVRFFSMHSALCLTRRVTLVSREPKVLLRSSMDLICNGLEVTQPDAFRRAPSRVERLDNGYRLSLWPQGSEPVTLYGGIALRQKLYCGGDVSCMPVPHAGYMAQTQAIGICYAQGADPERLAFPGFENAYRRMLEAGTLENTQHDSAFFGLLNDGDWPLGERQYGAQGYRCYADNEYDAAFAYMQGYAAFNKTEYLDIALRCAAHMADIDCNQTTGDMYYHGYDSHAEDHMTNRSGGENGHYWSDGLWLGWLMAGDIFCKRAALALAHLIINKIGTGDSALRAEFAFCERNLGWPLLTVLAGCEAGELDGTGEAFCRAVCAYLDRFTSAPDAEYELSGQDMPVWWRTAMQDGCKPFMLGVLLEGLERAHRLYGWECAKNALVRIAEYLYKYAFHPIRGDFTYEINAFGRGHRDINALNLNPLVLRGLAYAYCLTGDTAFRETSILAFHACLWTLYEPKPNGKDIALVGRSLSAFAAMAVQWAYAEEQERLSLMQSEGTSFAGSAIPPYFRWSTDHGDIVIRVSLEEGSTDYLNQRAFIHLCGIQHNGPAVSIITFYRNLSVRFYDANRRLIETLDSTLEACCQGGWQEGQTHILRVSWHAPGKADFYMDDMLLDSRMLSRPLSGAFTRFHIGQKPGNWQAKGKVSLVKLALGV